MNHNSATNPHIFLGKWCKGSSQKYSYAMIHHASVLTRAGGRAVDLGGPSVYQRAKFEIKHKSGCFQKRKLVHLGGGWASMMIGEGLAPPLVPALVSTMH